MELFFLKGKKYQKFFGMSWVIYSQARDLRSKILIIKKSLLKIEKKYKKSDFSDNFFFLKNTSKTPTLISLEMSQSAIIK